MFLINLVLILLLGCVVVKTVLKHDSPGNTSSVQAAPNGNSLSETSGPAVQLSRKNYDDIVARNLFDGINPSTAIGESAEQNQTISTEQLGELELNLVLQGTVAGPDDIARAIIRDLSTEKTNLYKTGDMVAGARIIGIKKDAVILLCRGQKKILKLSTYESPAGRDSGKKVVSSQPDTADKKPKTRAQIRNELLEDFIQTARIETYVVDDQPQGLKITGLEKIEMAELLGLKNGDVIQVVNNQKLTSKQKAFQVFKKAATQPYLDIELLRNDRLKTLSFPLK
ncbi:hypothetical protein ES703_63024 [subsurface metagenome]